MMKSLIIKVLYNAHQKSGDRVTETVKFYVITYTFVSELSKIMM